MVPRGFFDLIDMLLTDRPDTVFVVDELERSLHPKLTEHFLKLFMEAHDSVRMQLVFTTHEDTIMNQNLFAGTRYGLWRGTQIMTVRYIRWIDSKKGMTRN